MPLPKTGERLSASIHDTLAAFVLFGVVVFVQSTSGAYTSEFGSHPDEAAHVVTGLMVHDYLVSLNWSSPLQFAEAYYLHYPKVAFGHWPPLFYIIQALWMSAFGANRVSLLLLMASLCTAVAVTIYQVARRFTTTVFAGLAAVVFITLPVVQRFTAAVMADLPLTYFTFQATLAFARSLEGKHRYCNSLLFGLFASLAILTKGNGLLLILVPGFTLLLTRRFAPLRHPSFWLPVGIVAVLCAPVYLLTIDMMHDQFPYHASRATVFFSVSFYGEQLVHRTGGCLLVLAVVGVVNRVIIPLWRKEEIHPTWAALGSLFVSTWVFYLFVLVNPEGRYLLPLIPALLLFMVDGLQCVYRQVEKRLLLSPRLGEALVGMVVLFGTQLEFGLSHKDWRGYGEVASLITQKQEWTNAIVMVSSDPIGEGMLIAEVALKDHRPNRYVLRASKILAKDTWMGKRYQKRFDSPAEIMDFLTSIPVGILVIDISVDPSEETEHHRQLQAMIRLFSDKWHLVGQHALTRNGRLYPNAIHVYMLDGHEQQPPGQIEIDMQAKLGRKIQGSPTLDRAK